MISRVYSFSYIIEICYKQWGLGITGPPSQNWQQKIVLSCWIQLDANGYLRFHGEAWGENNENKKNGVSYPYPATLISFLKSQSTWGFVINNWKMNLLAGYEMQKQNNVYLYPKYFCGRFVGRRTRELNYLLRRINRTGNPTYKQANKDFVSELCFNPWSNRWLGSTGNSMKSGTHAIIY